MYDRLGNKFFNVNISSESDFVAIVPATSTEDIEALAVSIFMEGNETLERDQGSYSWVPLGIGQRGVNSSFSVEDLPSDIIGFYVGYHRRVNGITSTSGYANVRSKCRKVSQSDALEIFDQFYSTEFPRWTSWTPRFTDMEFGTGLCSPMDSKITLTEKVASRNFPPDFERLLSLRIHSSVNQTWWWYSDDPSWYLFLDAVDAATNPMYIPSPRLHRVIRR